MDGLSTDDTLSLIRGFNDTRIKLFSEKDEGVYDAMNKGVGKSSGNWLYFLGSDDTLYDSSVLRQVSEIIGGSNIEVLYGNVFFKKSLRIYDGEFTPEKIYRNNICHQAIFISKTLFNKIGQFNLLYKIGADYEHNIKWFNDPKIKKKYVDNIIANYSEEGLSNRIEDKTLLRDINYLITKNSKNLPVKLKFKIFKSELTKLSLVIKRLIKITYFSIKN